MKAASYFAGIGGFEVGLGRAGIETEFQCELDKDCQTILRKHYPTTTLMGDIADVSGTDVPGGIDLFAGGLPCQDTSIAAPNRAGLAGARSGQFFQFSRLIGEYARLVDSARPRWVVIENPTGLLRSNGGRDAATVFGHLEDLGYGWAYRVVDSRYVGSPQRRERVLVVGHRGGDPRPAWEVLGDGGAGAEAAGPGHDGIEVPRPRLGAVADGGGILRVWRKGARPRVALAKGYAGGYRETWVDDGTSNTLTGFDGGFATRQTHLVSQGGRLRTLTLTEWERLQGFPDGWTEGVSASARYKMLGNAMHVGMAEWLGRRMAAVNARYPMIGVA